MAVVIPGQTAAIVWAQWRALTNVYFRNSRGPWALLTGLALLIWYGLWVVGAVGIAAVASAAGQVAALRMYLPGALLFVFGYWQMVPVLLVSTGLSLDLARLLPYPVPLTRLFGIEVLLRLSTAPEMIIITAGLAVGLALNPDLPWWAPLPLLPFTLFNLLVSAGLRDLLSRLMSRRYFREAMVLGLVLLAATPQLFLLAGSRGSLRDAAVRGFGAFWPWSATASLNAVSGTWSAACLLLAWIVAAWWFGRRQFERTLLFDAAAARSSARRETRAGGWSDRVPRALGSVFRDPVAVMVESELRVLIRAPRFRLLFIMGFSFGLMIWLPMALGGDPDSMARSHYLTLVCAYALLLLGEVCFWNTFGMDRGAAAMWFVAPVPMVKVIVARNLATSVFIVLEVALVCLVCFLLRMPVTPGLVIETASVIAVLSVFLYAFGNLMSVRYPRPADPAQSWRNASGGRIQVILLLAYPVLGSPILLAYAARYAFEDEIAFYGVLLADLIVAAITYGVALDSAAAYAERNSENIVVALSQSQGPIGG